MSDEVFFVGMYRCSLVNFDNCCSDVRESRLAGTEWIDGRQYSDGDRSGKYFAALRR